MDKGPSAGDGSSGLADAHTLTSPLGEAHTLPVTASNAGAEAGDTVGPYRLVRPIGEGGMGEVWEADQLSPVRRRVALKLIKPRMGSSEIIARFESERQALALMQHPSIAQIFDAGTTRDGRPYFAMELVDGVPVTRYCDEQRQDVAARLRLFQHICDAVQHAHRKGVIHRDLKPSNVLVTVEAGAAMPKVIDFGLAKATQAQLGDLTQTEHGVWMGTPAYASPEQMLFIDGGVDTRSDVYSLAMLLYELLVGALPFDVTGSGTVFELRQRVSEAEFPRPSARFSSLPDRDAIAAARGSDSAPLRRQLAGDLGWIVLKGLERYPARRYGSVDELSADIGRHLRDEPVAAGPPSAAYRARKFVRRHRAGVAAASGLVLAMAAISLTTAVQNRRIAGERDRAAAEAAKAAAVTGFLQETIGAADPWQSGRDVSVRETLARAAARVDSSFVGQPLVAAAVRRAIGRTYVELGRYDDARPLLESALAARTELLGPQHLDVAESQDDLAVLLQRRGDLDAALAHDRAALAIRRAPGTLQHLSLTLYERGEFEAATRAGEEGLALYEEGPGKSSREASESLNVLSAIAGAQGDDARSEALALRTVEIRRAVAGPDAPYTADALNQLAIVRQAQGRLAESEALYREALAIVRSRLGADHPQTVLTMENLGGALLQAKRYDETLALLRDVLAIRRANLGADNPSVTRTMLNIATTEMKAGKLESAEAGFQEALPRIRSERGADHPDVASTLANFGQLRDKQGREEDALSLYREALAIQVRKLPPAHPRLARTQLAMGRILTRRGEHEEAEKLLLAAREALRGDAEQARSAADALAELYVAWGKPEQAARVKAQRSP